MYASLFSLGFLIVAFYNQRLFTSALLHHLYQVKTPLITEERRRSKATALSGVTPIRPTEIQSL
jgi:formate/nitrite transporter FocA (FNT family)